jgi:porphobilinogen synthase
MVAETIITPSDFIVPLFVTEGKGVKEEISSMPGYYRLSLDNLPSEIRELWGLGIKSVLLFVKVPDALKNDACTEALNPTDDKSYQDSQRR